MKKTGQTARKSVGGASTKWNEKVKRARAAEIFTWVFYMVRLIDVGDKLNVDGEVTADKLMLVFARMHDVYDLFGLDDEPGQNPYVGIGVEKRQSLNNRVDVYVMVGFKVRGGTDVSLNNYWQDQWDIWFCKEGENETLGLNEENVHIVQGDTEQIQWLERIIKDMEDTNIDGDIFDIID